MFLNPEFPKNRRQLAKISLLPLTRHMTEHDTGQQAVFGKTMKTCLSTGRVKLLDKVYLVGRCEGRCGYLQRVGNETLNSAGELSSALGTRTFYCR